ncbi:hypothetical protein JCM21714_1150 [Gracilibacillus boraciitolerans JCM 21714]|uniref:Uncharacterized protein n=1 Tax=Gracilibacillus boraciitolerans JCM 21714 TaxID=1298598 RepID=W4VH67_9BACI|nr:hypothetical protein [Gracilibacillus boraciitolerans]GAE92168.1 hypothetical protein JCM21714_1150 [Gracilibacillus boraciitolerans JCM 21714]
MIRHKHELENLYDGVFYWLQQQFDPIMGGFYYAKSSVRDDRFYSDIESTAQAINILLRQQLLEGMPSALKDKLIYFFQSKQDPNTGYFFDDHPNMPKDEVMVHRAFHYAISSLKRLGGEPLYKLPLEKRKAPAYTDSLSAYQAKWKGIDLRNSWRGCDLLASSLVYVNQMELEKQRIYVKALEEFLASIQDEETGLWGGSGSLYVRISGAFKLHTFYRRNQIPMPNQEKIYQSILLSLRTEEAVDMCYIRNPIDLLAYLEIEISEQELDEITFITIQNLKQLKRKDGAFSREINGSPSAPNVAQIKEDDYYPDMPDPVELGLGLVEGDMNATTQATLIRKQLHQLWSEKPEPLISSEQFWQTWQT